MMKFYLFFVFISLSFQQTVRAQTYTWTGDGDGYFWYDPQNWDQGTTPLQNGIGTVVIPSGVEVHSTSIINFKAGEFTGGGTLINNGSINVIHDSETNSTKTFSNIYIENNGPIHFFKTEGITNNEPVFLNEGAIIKTNSQQNTLLLDDMNISFSSSTPGKLEIFSPFNKTGQEDVFIDVETVICCYEFRVEGGSLLLEPSTENSIYGPDLFISGNASLIFSGKNKFTSSNGVDTRMEGINDGYLEIKNNGNEHPSIDVTVFFEVEGITTLKDVTFDGGGTFRVQKNNLVITGEEDITLDNVDIWVQSVTGTAMLGVGNAFNIHLLNGSRISGSGDFFLDGASILGSGSGEERFIVTGNLSVLNSTIEHQFNGINFRNYGITQLNNGRIVMDDNSIFYNHYFQDLEFPELVEFGEVLGSGTLRFPSFSSAADLNNGIFNPSPGTAKLSTVNYNQSATAKLLIDINGLNPITDFDVIENAGETNFEGSIEVNLTYAPSIGNEFMVLTSNTALNNCDPVSTTSANYDGFEYVFDVICNTDNITLKVSEIVLSVSELELNDTFSYTLTPNPANAELTLSIDAVPGDLENLKLQIYSLLGQKVKQVSVSANGKKTISISNLQSGIYLTQLRNGEGVLS